MSVESNITRDSAWHRHELKTLNIAVVDDAGAALDLDLLDLRWLLLRQAGGEILLEKTSEALGGITITGADDDVASIEIEVEDYADLPAGVYHHELWDTTDSVLLTFGDAYLGEGSAPAEEP